MSFQRGDGDLHGARSAGGRRGMLASDRDRDAVAGVLGEAFAEGRLTGGEHGERVSAAYAARTSDELVRLTADLPVPARPAAGRLAAERDGLDKCLMCALLVLCPPAGIAWLLAARRRSRPGWNPRPALAGLPGPGAAGATRELAGGGGRAEDR